jgi:plastocyanin domain-containing protein
LVIVLALAIGAFGCASRNASTADARRVTIQVTENGFEPAVVSAKAGEPITLVVTRTTDRTCATEMVFKDANLNIKRDLPLNKPVEITFKPSKTGDLVYACAMDMYRGTVRVE